MGSNFIDEIDCTNFFDQIEDLIEFPPDDECGAVGGYLAGSGDSKDIPSMWSDKLPDDGAIFSSSHADELSAELSVPYEDIAQLEWLSTFVEDSFSGGGMTLGKENLCTTNKSSPNQFQTSSPLSVLESSSSSSSSCGGKSKTVPPPLSPSHRGPQRARSKRPRPAMFSPRAAIQLISPSSSFIEAPHPFMGSHSFADSPVKRIPQLAAAAGEPKKKKKIKTTPPPSGPDQTRDPPSQEVRKCLHCEITKTPQWRAGPMGPKTLCNACGVRYKSGRLFPEYRPAASPTFVASVHSNSHKKVVEMRIKGVTAIAPPIPAKPDSGCSS